MDYLDRIQQDEEMAHEYREPSRNEGNHRTRRAIESMPIMLS